MSKKIGERRVRCDKKRSIAPYIDRDTHEVINRLSYICDLPNKSVGEMLGREGIQSKLLLEAIRIHFRRNYKKDSNHIFLGDEMNEPYRTKGLGEDRHRLYMKYYNFEYDRFADLAFALDCSVSMATGLVIHTAIRRKDIFYTAMGRGIIRDLDFKRAQQLRDLCRSLDQESPDTYITMPLVLAHILQKGLLETQKIKDTMDEWTK